MDDDRPNLQELLAIARRRIWLIISPFFVLFPLSVAVILMLPPMYGATGKILIEEPDIPRDLAISTISSAADKRLQTISQRVMTVDNLAHIIEARNLYPEYRSRNSAMEKVDRLRKHIVMELIAASGSVGGTIAFTVSFQHKDPKIALDVTNDLIALYLRENIRDRQFRAIQTAEFFESETRRIEGVIAGIEAELADLRRNHYGSLPEQLEFNQQLMYRAEEELRDLDRQAQALQGRRVYLQTEKTKLAGRSGGHQEPPEAEKLRTLRLELTSAFSRYGSDHPDVVRLRREITAINRMTAVAPGDRGTFQRQLALAETQLATARERYTDNHPEVVRLSRQVDALRASMASAPAAAASPSSAPANDPTSFLVQQLLQTVDVELASVSKQREAVRQRIADYERRIEATPGIQQTYQSLTRQLDATNEQYRDVRTKQTAAQMGELLELERKSERFSLVEPPTESYVPVKPKRKKLMALAFVFSVGFGFALTAALEMMDSSVRTPRQLVRFAGGPPLAVIPYITTKQEVARGRMMRATLCAGAVLLVAGALAFVHFKVMPLDAALTTTGELVGSAFGSGRP